MGACVGSRSVLPDGETLSSWYRASRALGYGERSGMYSENSLCRAYSAMCEGLESFCDLSRIDQLRVSAHFLRFFQLFEFEVSCQSLFSRFKPEVLRGLSKKEFHDLFLRYAKSHPETVIAREERERCIDALVKTGIVRREWFDINSNQC